VSQAPARPRPHLTLNTDGKRHPVLNAAAACSVLAGLVSFVLGMLLTTQHIAGSILGVSGLVIGLLAQMMSVTRAERMVIVFGIVASFVGMGLGLAHGGFS